MCRGGAVPRECSVDEDRPRETREGHRELADDVKEQFGVNVRKSRAKRAKARAKASGGAGA